MLLTARYPCIFVISDAHRPPLDLLNTLIICALTISTHRNAMTSHFNPNLEKEKSIGFLVHEVAHHREVRAVEIDDE